MDTSQQQQSQSTMRPFAVSLIAALIVIGGTYGGYVLFFKKKEQGATQPANQEQQRVQKNGITIPSLFGKAQEKTGADNPSINNNPQGISKEEEEEIPVVPQPILNPENAPTQAPSAPIQTPTLYPMTVKTTAVSVELAETREQQERGLGGRTGLAEDRGLLYILRKPDFYTFWMKDMTFPIDIIWIDKNQKVIDISHSLTPDTYPRIFQPVHPAQIILEVSAGFAKKHDIQIGDPVTVPKIQQ